MEVGSISCRQCGREIDDSLTWCPYCGAEQHPGEAVPLASAEIAAELDRDADEAPEDSSASATPLLPADWSGAGLPAAAAQPRPSRAVIIALGSLVLVGAATAAWFFLIRDDHRGEISLFDIAAGNCWNDPGGEPGDGELATVPEVPCDDPHAYEVFAVADLPGAEGAAYPGDEAAGIDGAQLCRDRFEVFAGVSYDESPLESSVLFPTGESWAAGDREVICSAYALDGSSLT
ncbi:MAG: septum formation family protein, partial [Actinobacteria bacterium]|nr:septum formation family protein [Actinomycetota bacterium]